VAEVGAFLSKGDTERLDTLSFHGIEYTPARPKKVANGGQKGLKQILVGIHIFDFQFHHVMIDADNAVSRKVTQNQKREDQNEGKEKMEKPIDNLSPLTLKFMAFYNIYNFLKNPLAVSLESLSFE
jgi:hypothetical protein